MKISQQCSEAFQLNNSLDIAALAEKYRLDQRLQVRDVLPISQIAQLSKCLEKDLEYKHAFSLDGRVGEVSPLQWRSFSEEDRRALMTRVMSCAAEGAGFWYGRCDISKSGIELLTQAFDWLNSESLLKAVRLITGISDLQSASGQATCFSPGDFLTRHRDVVEGESRKVAYVLNCATTRWHPDWGGLLQFFAQSGAPRDAWMPNYNSLSLFHVKHIHSVTCVAPFAAAPRLAISGWFSSQK